MKTLAKRGNNFSNLSFIVSCVKHHSQVLLDHLKPKHLTLTLVHSKTGYTKNNKNQKSKDIKTCLRNLPGESLLADTRFFLKNLFRVFLSCSYHKNFHFCLYLLNLLTHSTQNIVYTDDDDGKKAKENSAKYHTDEKPSTISQIQQRQVSRSRWVT
jgi:hypothetical protein